jgi:hypothetical protein
MTACHHWFCKECILGVSLGGGMLWIGGGGALGWRGGGEKWVSHLPGSI